MESFAARYFDGPSAIAHAVTVARDGDVLLIANSSGAVQARWPIDALKLAGDPLEDAVAMLTCTGWSQARLVLESPEARRAMVELGPQLRRLAGRRRGALHWAAYGVGAVAMLGIAWLAIDRLPAWLAPLVPSAWESWVGEQVLTSMAGADGICSSPAGDAALDGLAARLSAAAGFDTPVEVSVIDSGEVNAFAAPGGRIAILRGLIDKAPAEAGGADEVAGVLAHEIGHVVHRHPTEGVLRQLGLAATIQMLVGGSATGLEDAAGLGQLLVTLRYSRSAEIAADAAGLELLAKAGIDGRGLSRFFTRMESDDGIAGLTPVWLLTHPATEDRLAATASAAPGAPALNAAEWKAVRSMCDDE